MNQNSLLQTSMLGYLLYAPNQFLKWVKQSSQKQDRFLLLLSEIRSGVIDGALVTKNAEYEIVSKCKKW